MRKGVSIGLTAYGQELSVTKTASELLFEGYEDDMVTMGKEMLSADDVPFDRVGFFYMVGFNSKKFILNIKKNYFIY